MHIFSLERGRWDPRYARALFNNVTSGCMKLWKYAKLSMVVVVGIGIVASDCDLDLTWKMDPRYARD